MSHAYVTSDWHFGHKGITSFRTQFPSMEFMEDYIMENCLATVTKRDVLYCLGDMAFDQRGLEKIREIPCRKILVRGNHDELHAYKYLSVFDDVCGVIRYKKYWLTHIPIHPMELFRGKNIHGHCHRGGPNQIQNCEGWENYFNAILEYNDYRPINMQMVGTILQEQYKVVHRNERKAGTE